ncbi:MAG: CotH kinase family protein [Saprospiraceae bacterium]
MKKLYLLFPLLFLLCSPMLMSQEATRPIELLEFRLFFPGQDWQRSLDSLRFNGTGTLAAQMTDPGAGGRLDVAVRYRTGRGFQPGEARNSMLIELPTGTTINGSGQIWLGSALRDPSLVREVLAAEMANRFFAAPEAGFAKLYVNGQYRGLFVLQEAVDSDFLDRHFDDGGKGNLFLAEANSDYVATADCAPHRYNALETERDPSCFGQFYQLLQADNYAPLARFSQNVSAETVDLDATLWMLAFNNLFVNLYSYSGQFANNYYLYQRASDQKWVPIPGEMNLAFGGYKNSGGQASDLDLDQLAQLDPLLHADDATRPLISKLLADPINRMTYQSHLRTLLQEYVLSGWLEKRTNFLRERIRPAVESDSSRFYEMADFDRATTETIGRRSRVPGLLAFMQQRGDYLRKQSVYTALPPAIKEQGVRAREKFSAEKLDEFRVYALVDDFPKGAVLYYRLGADDGPFQRLEMSDDGSHHDGEAGDGTFGAVVPAAGNTTLHYYLRTENAAAVGFSPVDYHSNRHTADLATLNK